MSTPPSPAAGATTEFDLLGALFSPAGRADPQVILRGSPLPGCQYPFVRDVLRDPRFAAPTIPPSPDPAFQLPRRWMMRLDGDRHRRVRDAWHRHCGGSSRIGFSGWGACWATSPSKISPLSS